MLHLYKKLINLLILGIIFILIYYLYANFGKSDINHDKNKEQNGQRLVISLEEILKKSQQNQSP